MTHTFSGMYFLITLALTFYYYKDTRDGTGSFFIFAVVYIICMVFAGVTGVGYSLSENI